MIMKKIYLSLIFAAFSFFAISQVPGTPWTGRTYCKIVLDTKLMEAPSCSLGGGGGIAATWPRVYAHLGLCTCAVTGGTRNCSNATQNEEFCFSQITPYQSQVWQHVVGNWGEIAQDDGVGLMQTLGNGVYSIEFIIEDYFSSNQVSTEQTATSPVPSMKWNVNQGGKPYTMGMVFRNADGTSSGRDFGCNDLFMVNILTNPVIIQSTDPEGPTFPAITVEIRDASIEDVMTLSDNTRIYPNPATESFSIKYKNVVEDNNVVISIYDVNGKIVKQFNIGKQTPGWYEYQISTEDFNQGIYMVYLSMNNYVAHSERVLIVK